MYNYYHPSNWILNKYLPFEVWKIFFLKKLETK